ncbi:hypothetical protein BO99DRAFT_198102 [Aspergillus violaceofuscus CBS 115571]|uniref:Uncharacterized protein n=1 Tax=Aspergillus violaceofuscus (strain CBS 115571) TaxID=1450538 RepID=A0A2V5HNT7_ASPV1|nr:hypothetical protein BO99DRAFT_198102 [Aspergillus violaceofuscus CBS 115571]
MAVKITTRDLEQEIIDLESRLQHARKRLALASSSPSTPLPPPYSNHNDDDSDYDMTPTKGMYIHTPSTTVTRLLIHQTTQATQHHHRLQSRFRTRSSSSRTPPSRWAPSPTPAAWNPTWPTTNRCPAPSPPWPRSIAS